LKRKEALEKKCKKEREEMAKASVVLLVSWLRLLFLMLILSTFS
jgi:hypothetical protein